MTNKKKILMIATGGTIASQHTATGLSPLLSSEELLSFVPEVTQFSEIDTLQLMNLDSTNIRPEHWLKMTSAIKENYDSYDGFVLCHGTDTMAYTAAALSYLIQNTAKPVVITGAQRPIDVEVTDAKTNLADSIRFASDPDAHGVVIVFGGRAIAGTRAKKMRTKSYNAFSSINFPDIAILQDSRVIFYIRDKKPVGSPIFFEKLNGKVFLLKMIPGLDANILDTVGDNYDAVIIESYGVGGIPNDKKSGFLSGLDRLIKKGKTVIMATQVIHEGSDMAIYQVGHLLKEHYQLMENYDMTLASTVTKIMWILGQTTNREEMKRLFYQTVNYDMLFQNELE